MLVLNRKSNDQVIIAQTIEITILAVRGNRVRLEISASRTLDQTGRTQTSFKQSVDLSRCHSGADIRKCSGGSHLRARKSLRSLRLSRQCLSIGWPNCARRLAPRSVKCTNIVPCRSYSASTDDR